jgi:hypothetical protein
VIRALVSQPKCTKWRAPSKVKMEQNDNQTHSIINQVEDASRENNGGNTRRRGGGRRMDIDRSELSSSSSSLSHSNNDIGVGNDVRVENFNSNNSAVMARTTIMTSTIATATTSTANFYHPDPAIVLPLL